MTRWTSLKAALLAIEGDGIDDAGRMLEAWQQLASWGVAGSISDWHAQMVRRYEALGLLEVPEVPEPLPAGPGGWLDASTIAEIRARHRWRRKVRPR